MKNPVVDIYSVERPTFNLADQFVKAERSAKRNTATAMTLRGLQMFGTRSPYLHMKRRWFRISTHTCNDHCLTPYKHPLVSPCGVDKP